MRYRKITYAEGWRRIGAASSKTWRDTGDLGYWFVPETGVTISTAPRTIHDFGGFRANSISRAIRRRAIPISRALYRSCSRLWQC